MRRQLVETIEFMMAEDERLVLILGDIGVFGFRNAFARFPGRVYNIGILEQATINIGRRSCCGRIHPGFSQHRTFYGRAGL